MQLERVLLFDSRRQTYDQTRKCAEMLMLLGQVSVLWYAIQLISVSSYLSYTTTCSVMESVRVTLGNGGCVL